MGFTDTGMWLDGRQQVGVAFCAMGGFLLTLGSLLFFNRDLLTIGNFIFLAGLILIIGFRKAGTFFFRRTKWRGSAALLVGLGLIMYRRTFWGMTIEFFGFLNLFGDFFPYLLVFMRKVPFVGRVFSTPLLSQSNVLLIGLSPSVQLMGATRGSTPTCRVVAPWKQHSTAQSFETDAETSCQKCLQPGHWTFDCRQGRTYRPRPSRTALLADPALRLPEADIATDDFEAERETAAAEILNRRHDEEESDALTEDEGETGKSVNTSRPAQTGEDYDSSDFTTDDEDVDGEPPVSSTNEPSKPEPESSSFSDSEGEGEIQNIKRSRKS